MAGLSLPLTGRCQCGATRYEITAAPHVCHACHCGNCQRITGSAFAVNFLVPRDAFRFTAGIQGSIGWTADSGNLRVGHFCTDCGCRITHRNVNGEGMLTLRCGTLDDTALVMPVADIWLSSKQAWVRPDPDRLQFGKAPLDRAALARLYAERIAA